MTTPLLIGRPLKKAVLVVSTLTFVLLAHSLPAQSPADEIAAAMEQINLRLEASGINYRAGFAEYLSVDGEAMGNTVVTKVVGNKQSPHDFVPGDPRGSGGTNITYAIDTTSDAAPPFGGLSGASTDAAILRATETWDALRCSDLGLVRNPDFGVDIGVAAFLNGSGGSPFIFAHIQHAGWGDIDFPGGTIAATITFIFVDPTIPSGPPTDIDSNGKLDTAFREIYYDPSFNWADDGVSNLDVESVALHELGHGLSQTHFGKVFIDKKGDLKFAPKAVMNGVYTGPQRKLLGTDNGGHCSNWAQWPKN